MNPLSDYPMDDKYKASLEEKIYLYQLNELHQEIAFLNRRLAYIPKSLEIICRRSREFFWTITSILGLSHLHDGKRKAMPDVANNPTLNLSDIRPDDMPTPRLFLDVTATYKTKFNTGVQRVIRELCRHGVVGGELAPVIVNDDRFVTLPDLETLIFKKGDRVLLLDSGWTNLSAYPPALENACSHGAEIILGIHDIIPLQYPGFVHPCFTTLFDKWLKTIAPFCTSAIAVSRCSAEAFMTWSHENMAPNNISFVGWFHLGANIPKTLQKSDAYTAERNQIPERYILTVGTIEPRKGYSVALDAFDKLWGEGSALSYVIIGRCGELNTHIQDRIINHPLFGKQLFWPEKVDDNLLKLYYENSLAVLIPTLAEGFGLPLVESIFYNKPIIASDLPIFKEIAPKGVSYFSTADSLDLFNKIEDLNYCAAGSELQPIDDWENATSNMIRIIKKNDYQINRDNS